MKYCVIDTERIKGDEIYLFAYQIYSEDFLLIESKSFQDTSIDLTTRKSPKSKVKRLKSSTEKVNSFSEIYSVFSAVTNGTYLVVFSDTDLKIIRKKCKKIGIGYEKVNALDIQKILLDLSSDEKHKSNLKDFCKVNGIKYDPHLPESDCKATFEAFKILRSTYDDTTLEKYRCWI